MDTNRRTFLTQIGVSVGVVGLGYLLSGRYTPAGSPADVGRPPLPDRTPGLLKEALGRMKAEGKPGIALRIPADKKLRHLPGHQLIGLLNDFEQQYSGLFAETVFVCLEGPALQAGIRGATPSHAMVLFDTNGRATAGIEYTYENSWETFVPEVTALLHGEGNRRIRARAEQTRRRADPALIEAVDRLETEAHRERVLRDAATIGPWLVYERLVATSPARESALGYLLRCHLEAASATTPGPRLPYGIETGEFRGGCGSGDSCEEQVKEERKFLAVGACGMALVAPQARSFIRYITS
jgi:hypothetical protein